MQVANADRQTGAQDVATSSVGFPKSIFEHSFLSSIGHERLGSLSLEEESRDSQETVQDTALEGNAEG